MLTTLPPSRAVVTKSGNLNFLELSGLLQACNGTALPLVVVVVVVVAEAVLVIVIVVVVVMVVVVVVVVVYIF